MRKARYTCYVRTLDLSRVSILVGPCFPASHHTTVLSPHTDKVAAFQVMTESRPVCEGRGHEPVAKEGKSRARARAAAPPCLMDTIGALEVRILQMRNVFCVHVLFHVPCLDLSM